MTETLARISRTWELIRIPAMITLVVTVLRLLGELLHWSPFWFNSQPGGGAALIGIVWLAPIFGIYFALKLKGMGETPKDGRAIGFAFIGLLVIVGGMILANAIFHAGPAFYYHRQSHCCSGRSYPALWLAKPLKNTFGLWFRCTYTGRHRHVLCNKRKLGYPLRWPTSGISGDGVVPQISDHRGPPPASLLGHLYNDYRRAGWGDRCCDREETKSRPSACFLTLRPRRCGDAGEKASFCCCPNGCHGAEP